MREGRRPPRHPESIGPVKPIVGVTSYALERASWGRWTEPAILVPATYVLTLEASGARPLILPPTSDAVDETLDLLDAVVLSGGSDVDPEVYGAEPHPLTDPPRPERDEAEIALLERALARDMPVLAICRGSQLLNVARGGELLQHLPDVVGDKRHRETPGRFSDHEVEVKVGSLLERIVGRRASVKSHHHQGYGEIGDCLEPVAWADDGTMEAVEDASRPFALGVLWHPEEEDDPPLVRALVAEARGYAEAHR
jgi:putative glutamine amidotransferase